MILSLSCSSGAIQAASSSKSSPKRKRRGLFGVLSSPSGSPKNEGGHGNNRDDSGDPLPAFEMSIPSWIEEYETEPLEYTKGQVIVGFKNCQPCCPGAYESIQAFIRSLDWPHGDTSTTINDPEPPIRVFAPPSWMGQCKRPLSQLLADEAAQQTQRRGGASPKDEPPPMHDLQVGDHVIRWSHLAYMYPIQIHGIVLETTRTTVTMADFGLTSASEDASKAQAVKAEFDRQHSNTSRRLNVVVLTTAAEMKRWKKVNYGGKHSSLKKNKVDKLVKWLLQVSKLGAPEKLDKASLEKLEKINVNQDKPLYHEEIKSSPPSRRTSIDSTASIKPEFIPEDPYFPVINPDESMEEEWHAPIWSPIRKSPSEVNLHNKNKSKRKNKSNSKKPALSIFVPWIKSASESESDSEEDNAPQQLPKSDPVKIVLARVNFLLEHDERDHVQDSESKTDDKPKKEPVLPPYHVFYSNSECIAVWCKTGTWSTLQAAIFLHSTAIGNGKQIFLAISGVAAVQPWLIPALAGFGVAYIGAPWLYLSKCQQKWEQATLSLTDKFWAWAPPAVYVEAIQHWSRLK